MIYDVFVITGGGIAIYHKSFGKSIIDEQLLSGFLTAISDFSKETMGEKLQKIDVQTNQLIVHFDATLNLTIAGLTSKKDHLSLIKRVLIEIAEAFYDKFKDYYKKNQDRTDINFIQRGFDPIVEAILEPKIRDRSLKYYFFGFIIGLLILGSLSILMSFIFDVPVIYYFMLRDAGAPFQNIYEFVVINGILQLMLLIELVPSSLALGYIAGTSIRKKAMIMTLIIVIFFISSQSIYFAFLYIWEGYQFGTLTVGALVEALVGICFLPFYFMTSFMFIYYGGLLMEKKYLYPIPPRNFLP